MISIEQATRREDDKWQLVVAAYIFGLGYALSTPYDQLDQHIPSHDLRIIGAEHLTTGFFDIGREIEKANIRASEFKVSESNDDTRDFLSKLGELIDGALDAGLVIDIIARGMKSTVPLIRLASLFSAMQNFNKSLLGIPLRLEWFLNRFDKLDEISKSVFTIIYRNWQSDRIESHERFAHESTPYSSKQENTLVKKSTILVHGTHLPFTSEPTWHLPGTGALFNYLKCESKNPYEKSDFFQWEGNWTGRGRNIAGRNLKQWIDLHDLNDGKIVGHSHGCNVIMKAAELGATIDKAVLLSCPVHWDQYNNDIGNIGKITSVRVIWDFAIMADRGKQRFPPTSGVEEIILPNIAFSHGLSTDPEVWSQNCLADHL